MSVDEKTVQFYWAAPGDIIAMTHGGQFPVERFPPGMPGLDGTSVDNMLAMMATVRDEGGSAVGVLSELEVFGRDGETDYDVELTVVVPGRGALFVHQIKSLNMPDVAEPYRVADEHGSWEGSVPTIHTAGPLPENYGIVVGGSGEFAGAHGRHQQTAIYRKIENGVSFADVTETFYLGPPRR